jgi:hypothetical protein
MHNNLYITGWGGCCCLNSLTAVGKVQYNAAHIFPLSYIYFEFSFFVYFYYLVLCWIESTWASRGGPGQRIDVCSPFPACIMPKSFYTHLFRPILLFNCWLGIQVEVEEEEGARPKPSDAAVHVRLIHVLWAAVCRCVCLPVLVVDRECLAHPSSSISFNEKKKKEINRNRGGYAVVENSALEGQLPTSNSRLGVHQPLSSIYTTGFFYFIFGRCVKSIHTHTHSG